MASMSARLPAGPSRFGPQIAWTMTVAAVVAQVALIGVRAFRGDLEPVAGLALLSLPLSGALVVNQHPRNPIGWILIAAGVSSVIATQIDDHGLFAAAPPPSPSPWLALASDVTWPLGFPLLVCTIPLLYPLGTTERRWQWPLRAGIAGTVLLLVTVVLGAWGDGQHGGLANPLAPSNQVLPRVAGPIGLGLVAATGIAGIVRLALLHRRGGSEERAQVRVLLWFAAGAAALIAAVAALEPVVGSHAWVDQALPAPIVAGFPIAVAYAVTRRRLYGYRVVLHRRALVAVARLVAAAAAFATTAAVLGPGAVSRTQSFLVGVAAMLAALGAGAIVGRVLGRRLKGFTVDTTVLTRLPGHATLDRALDEWVRLVRDAVGSPGVELRIDGRPPIRAGTPAGLPAEHLPLGPEGAPYGRLVVAWRSASEQYDRHQGEILAGLAHLIADAIEHARSAEEATRSRQALAASVAEERERLNRDVHDQLGPRLAGISYLLAAVESSPDGAEYLERARVEIVAAGEDVRRMAHDLQPRPVEQHGLAEAIRRHAVPWADAAGIDLELAVDEVVEVEEAVATAIYSVALEAMANVQRHARASWCRIELRRLPEGLRLTVRDDGAGMPATVEPGLGIGSMTRRAQQLGGSLTIGTGVGTTVACEVPLSA
jgi:two-component system NarL family sensor kinase